MHLLGFHAYINKIHGSRSKKKVVTESLRHRGTNYSRSTLYTNVDTCNAVPLLRGYTQAQNAR
jgi:hypothetical protein